MSKDVTTYVASIGEGVVGTYVLKPNQPGLGSHVANAGHMVKSDYAGKGIWKGMICCSLFSGIRLFLASLLNKRIP